MTKLSSIVGRYFLLFQVAFCLIRILLFLYLLTEIYLGIFSAYLRIVLMFFCLFVVRWKLNKVSHLTSTLKISFKSIFLAFLVWFCFIAILMHNAQMNLDLNFLAMKITFSYKNSSIFQRETVNFKFKNQSIHSSPVLLHLTFTHIPKKVNWEQHIPQDSEQWEWQKAVSDLFDERPIWVKDSLCERLKDRGLEIRSNMLRRLQALSLLYK